MERRKFEEDEESDTTPVHPSVFRVERVYNPAD